MRLWHPADHMAFHFGKMWRSRSIPVWKRALITGEVESPRDSLNVVLLEGCSSASPQDEIISRKIGKWEPEQWDVGKDQNDQTTLKQFILLSQWRRPPRNDKRRKGWTFPKDMNTIIYMYAKHDLPQRIRREFQIHEQGTQQDLRIANQYFVSAAWQFLIKDELRYRCRWFTWWQNKYTSKYQPPLSDDLPAPQIIIRQWLIIDWLNL